MTRASFDEIRRIIYDASGIQLSAEKSSLLTSRLYGRLRHLGYDDFDRYVERLRGSHGEEERVQLIDLISTNVTSFFRDAQQFQSVEEHLRALAQLGQTRFRLWSAASASGEEPYTLAMVANETLAEFGANVRILATDISSRALRHCQEACYELDSVEGVPAELRRRYFEDSRLDGAPRLRICKELRALVRCARLNLSRPPFPMSGPLDAVLCRNVMIYFDLPVRQRLLQEIHRLLAPGGLLVLGAAESLMASGQGFQLIRPCLYRKPPARTG